MAHRGWWTPGGLSGFSRISSTDPRPPAGSQEDRLSGTVSFTIGDPTPAGSPSASIAAATTADQPAPTETGSNSFPFWVLAAAIAALIGTLGALRYRSARNKI